MPFLFLQTDSFHSLKMKIYEQTSYNLPSLLAALHLISPWRTRMLCPLLLTSQIHLNSSILLAKQRCQFSPLHSSIVNQLLYLHCKNMYSTSHLLPGDSIKMLPYKGKIYIYSQQGGKAAPQFQLWLILLFPGSKCLYQEKLTRIGKY